MQQALEATEDEEALETANVSRVFAHQADMTYSVDDDGREHSRRNCRAIFGILLPANELRMVALEEKAEH
jgi:hypothetical protein